MAPSKSLRFNIVDVIRQVNSYDCGLHAIAAATDIVFGRDPAKSRWDVSQMRCHLSRCFEDGKMSVFPVTGERLIRFGRRVKTSEEINIYCDCRMPFDCDKDLDEMIECQLCLVWYHVHCVDVDITKYTRKKRRYCVKCKEYMH